MITISSDEGNHKYSIYSARVATDAGIDIVYLSVEDESYLVLYSKGTIYHGIRYDKIPTDFSKFMVSTDGEAWTDSSLHIQATLLAALELLDQSVTLVQRQDDVEHGYKALVAFMESCQDDE
jgi:hypothetical protein